MWYIANLWLAVEIIAILEEDREIIDCHEEI